MTLAWVAGATGGIGSACLAALERAGYRVHASDRPDEDITLPGTAERVTTELAATGEFRAAVFAVGMSGRRFGDGPVSEATDGGWDEVLRVDLTSAFYFLRACLRTIQPGGSIVLVGSALATTLDRDFLTAAYRVAKAGIIPLAEAAAFEGAVRGIRVNVVSPGLVETPMAARAIGDPAVSGRFAELMPLSGRPAFAEEVAATALWLIGDGSSQTTGSVIPVDGGWSLR